MLKLWLRTACCLAVAAGMLLTTAQGRAADAVSIAITNAGSVGLFVIAIIGFVLSLIFNEIEKRVVPWKR
jgi:ABC-type nitrate/sulfonate/bicarbonate transport system permease component